PAPSHSGYPLRSNPSRRTKPPPPKPEPPSCNSGRSDSCERSSWCPPLGMLVRLPAASREVNLASNEGRATALTRKAVIKTRQCPGGVTVQALLHAASPSPQRKAVVQHSRCIESRGDCEATLGDQKSARRTP